MNAWPVVPTLRGYRRSWLGPDLIGGVTLAAIAVPSQMATARLADMPAVAGLDAFVVGSLVFALIGCSRQMSVGADSTIAPVLAAGVATVAAVGSPSYDDLLSFLALAVGVVVVVIGLLRLGWIAEFLSTPVVTGVLAGIAVEIAVRQLPAVLGVAGGGTTTIGRLRAVVDQRAHVNVWAVGIAVGVLVVIVVAQRIDHRAPGALVGLVASVAAVAGLGLERHGVEVLGSIQGGFPTLQLPSASWTDVRHLVEATLTVAFLCVAQTAATVRESQAGAPAARDFDRDLVALGAGSVAAGLIGSFAVDSSPPNTAIVTAAGGRSQLTNLVAVAIVAGVVLVATGPLDKLPQATLGAILIFVSSRLFRLRDLRSIVRFDPLEFGLAVATLVVVALVGIEQGVVVAMLLSLADRTRKSARPRDAVLGRVRGTDHWIPTDIGTPTESVPGVIVYLIYAPLWYGNADYVRLRVRTVIDSAAQPVRVLVVDADGISDIDYTGMRALAGLVTELAHRGISIGLARTSHLVHHDLKHGALLELIGDDHLFTSVAAAVAALTPPP